jgi:hypothetical protein
LDEEIGASGPTRSRGRLTQPKAHAGTSSAKPWSPSRTRQCTRPLGPLKSSLKEGCPVPATRSRSASRAAQNQMLKTGPTPGCEYNNILFVC